MPARVAATMIMREAFATARENERGILADTDVEYLHNYRVCVRRIRSLLSLVRGVFPDARATRLKVAFATLASRSNRLRDLDVYLAAREQYLALLPNRLRPGLTELFSDFEAERAREHRRVAVYLASAGYARTSRSMELFLAGPDKLAPSKNSAVPIGPLIAVRLRRRYRRICKLNRNMGPDTPDKAIHAVRIQCKKLRYLLEFFGGLFPGKAGRNLEKQLRRLQNRLGTFNDYSVQKETLLEYWRMKEGDDDTHETLAVSLGALVGVLHSRQSAERARIFQALEEFCSPGTTSRFKRTYRKSGF